MNIQTFRNVFSGYTELRMQENRVAQISLLRGDAVANSRSASGGVCARVYKNGSWGFASTPEATGDAVVSAIKNATDNASFLDAHQHRGRPALPSRPGTGKKSFRGGREASQKELMEFMRALDAYVAGKYPALSSRSLFFQQLDIEKTLITSDGAEFSSFIPRSIIGCSLTAEREGAPVSSREVFGGLGTFDRRFSRPEDLFADLDALYEHLRRKQEGVYAEKGAHVCVLDADLAGILAHEAIGHTVEADFVLAGSVARGYMGKQVAPPCVTLIDYANTAEGETCPVPVYTDDEGTEARDAVVIENGVLKSFQLGLYGSKKTGFERAKNAGGAYVADAGATPYADIVKSVKRGLLVCRFSGGSPAQNGDLTGVAKNSYYIEDGEIQYPVSETMIAGNLERMFRGIRAVSAERTDFGGGVLPYVAVSGMTIVGK